MKLLRPARIVAIAAFVCAIASACASTTTSKAPEAPTSPSPSATAEQLPVPFPVLDLQCDQLLPSGVGAGLLTEQLRPLEAEEVRYTDLEITTPPNPANQQAGGTSCGTDNGEPMLVDGEFNPAWAAITAMLVPSSAEQFAEFRTFGSIDGTEEQTDVASCGEGPPDSCSLDLLVDDNWVSLQFWGIDPALPRDPATGLPPQIAEIAEGVRSVMIDVTASSTRWAPPTDTAPLTFDCALFFGPERIQADFGITETVYLDSYEDYPSAERASRELAPALACPWHDDLLRVFGGHSTLAGGEWAFRQLEESGEFADHVPLQLTGLAASDTAIMTCSPETDRCTADLIVGRNWVQLFVAITVNDLDEQAATAKLAALAQTAVDSIRG